jgi:hypothetical protein
MLSIIYSNKKDLSSKEEYKIQCFVIENFINMISGAFVYNCKNIINRDYLIKIEVNN